MSTLTGSTIGPFRITAELGRGGMGVVYRATDSRLGRDVALKALPDSLASDPERLARFEREARTLAALNHTSLAAIHGVEQQDGSMYLVLELVEGPTLAQLLDRGPLPPEEAVAYAVQICEALAAAHEARIIHRDLKPDNIKVTQDGRIKILDFGLAKEDEHSSTTAHAPTLASPQADVATLPGAILGTAAYMSPEQARGRSVDRRTDVWSFGVVLYEMLTGINPFRGETATDSIGAILHKAPELSRLPPGTPPNVRRVLSRCLERDKSLRYRDLADVAIDLTTAEAEPERAATGRPGWVIALAAACALLAFAVALLMLRGPAASAPPPLVAQIGTPRGVEFSLASADPGVPRLSPDGTMVAFTGRDKDRRIALYVTELTTGRTRVLQGTENAQYHFWSPDSRSLGFFADGLFRIEAMGGPPRRLADASNGKGGSWSERGTIIYAPVPTGPLYTVPAAGGSAAPVSQLNADSGDYSHRHPHVLPGGRAFVYTRWDTQSTRSGKRPEIWVRSIDGDTDRRLVESDANAIFAGGDLLYVVGRTLVARPFDLGTLAFTGEARPVAQGVLVLSSATLAVFDAAPTGAMLLLQGEAVSQDRRLVFRDRTGAELETAVPRIGAVSHRLTADGTKALATTADPATGEIRTLLLDLRSGGQRLFENDIPSVQLPAVTRGGDRIAHFAVGPRDTSIYVEETSGFAAARKVGSFASRAHPVAFSADGRSLICFVAGEAGVAADANRAEVLSLDGPATKTPLPLSGAENLWTIEPSPDGRWYAYIGAYRGEPTLFLAPTANPTDGRRIPVPRVNHPRWSADSRQLFFHGSDGMIYCLPIRTLPSGDADLGTPAALFNAGVGPAMNGTYDVTPDGERFLIAEPIARDVVESMTYMSDWRSVSGK